MDREGGTEDGWTSLAPLFADAGEEFVLQPDDEGIIRLMEEFRRRQRRRPDLVVRPWWTPPRDIQGHPRVGFVVEYCPDGRDSAELLVRADRVTVDGPTGALDAALELGGGSWGIDGRDAACPETLANYLLRMADRVLQEGEVEAA